MTEAIQNQRESILEGDFIPAGTSERVFSTLTGLADYIKVFGIENARFGKGYIEGRKVYVLQHQPINYGGN